MDRLQSRGVAESDTTKRLTLIQSNVEVPWDLLALLLRIHPKDVKRVVRERLSTVIFIAALFTTAMSVEITQVHGWRDGGWVGG